MIHYRDEHLGRLLQSVYRDFNDKLRRKMSGLGYEDLTQFQAELLSYIELDGSRASSLADKTDTTKQAIGETLSHLASSGYIKKVVDPKDRRGQVLFFTKLGEQFLFDEHRVKAELEQEYSELLGSQNFEILKKMLQAITIHKQAQRKLL